MFGARPGPAGAGLGADGPQSDDVTPAFDLASSAALVVLPLVGALIASRRPGNAIGWLFCGAGLLLAVAGATYGYAAYGLVVDPALPGGVASAWLTSWIFLPAVFGIPALLFLLFPDGRPMSRRWRPAVVLTAVGLACQAAAAALRPGPMEDSPVPGIANPVAVSASGWSPSWSWSAGHWRSAPSSLATVTGAAVPPQSSGDERLQLRWFAFSAVLFGAGLSGQRRCCSRPEFVGLGQALVLVAFNTDPVAAGVAILRHRLYDIDVVINRTLVYGSLTATLLAVLPGVGAAAAAAAAARHRQSDLAVAASTLAVAALFGPARAPHPGRRRPPLLPQPVRRRPDPRRRSPTGCATRSTWRRSAPTCGPPSARPCSPRTSRSGCRS